MAGAGEIETKRQPSRERQLSEYPDVGNIVAARALMVLSGAG